MNAAIPLKERVLAAAAATPSQTRTQGRRLTMSLVGLSSAVGLILFELAGGIGHAAARPLHVTVRLADGWALAACWLTWMVTRQSAPRVRSRRVLLAASIASPLVMCAWARCFHCTYGEFAARALGPCVAFTLLAAAAPLGASVGMWRGIEPDHPGSLGAAAGAMCGAWAGVLAFLWCPSMSAAHVALGHAAPVGLCTGLGLLFGRHALGVRRLGLTARTARTPGPPRDMSGED
jgi:Negative regulator of sigma F